jgi:hypothetical protein
VIYPRVYQLVFFSVCLCVCEGTLSSPDPPHSVSICAKHTHMLTHMNTHASLACKHLMYAWTCTHECKNTYSLYVCVSLWLCASVICLWIFAHTCIHAHTNARNGCTYCMHPCKCTKVHTSFLSRSLFFIHLGSLLSLPCFLTCRHISSHTRATYLYVCVWVCICVLNCLCVCLFCFSVRACVCREGE